MLPMELADVKMWLGRSMLEDVGIVDDTIICSRVVGLAPPLRLLPSSFTSSSLSIT